MQYVIPQVWNVNKNVPIPLFKQLADNIKWSICLGNITEGYRLPPVRQTAKELGISVDTVRASYKLLETMGLVVTRPNHGTEVIKQSESGDGSNKFEEENEFLSVIAHYYSKGLTEDEIRRFFTDALEKNLADNTERILFIDCNDYDCRNFSKQLFNYLNIPVDYLLIESLDSPENFRNKNYKAIITTYFHYSRALQSLKPLNIPIFGVVTELRNEAINAIKKFAYGTKIGAICEPSHSLQYMVSLIENIRGDLDIRTAILGRDAESSGIIDWADVFFITHPCTDLIVSRKPDATLYYFCDQINAQSVGILRESLNSLC